MRWYFAYGSNLHAERLEDRVRRIQISWKLASLDNYRLSFDKPAGDGSGYAMITPQHGDKVHGVLYALHEDELTRLDAREGVPKHYVRRTIDGIIAEDKLVSAECYFAVHPSDHLLPRREYLEFIISGARNYGLPLHYIDRLQAIQTFD